MRIWIPGRAVALFDLHARSEFQPIGFTKEQRTARWLFDSSSSAWALLGDEMRERDFSDDSDWTDTEKERTTKARKRRSATDTAVAAIRRATRSAREPEDTT